jgi:hypothetical protein
MLSRSFRLVAARLIPRPRGAKPALILVVCILAGCGGTSHGNQRAVRVAGSGFSFAAPAGWAVRHAPGRATAARGSELVQVATFPLQHPYTQALFSRVEPELSLRMKAVARQSGGRLSAGASVTVAGIRSHVYHVEGGGHVDEYTFVLSGRREYQLLCRRRASSSDEACRRLVTSFRVA